MTQTKNSDVVFSSSFLLYLSLIQTMDAINLLEENCRSVIQVPDGR